MSKDIRVQTYCATKNQWSAKAVVETDKSLMDFLASVEEESNVRIYVDGNLAFTLYRNAKFTGSLINEVKNNRSEDLS